MDYYQKYIDLLSNQLDKDKEIMKLKNQVSSLQTELLELHKKVKTVGVDQNTTNNSGSSTESMNNNVSTNSKTVSVDKKNKTEEVVVKNSPKSIKLTLQPLEKGSADEKPSVVPSTLDKAVRQNIDPLVLDLEELGELVSWTDVFKRSHPGQLGYLRKHQRDRIAEAAQDFLIGQIGEEQTNQCFDKDGKICIPTELIDDFQTWFDDRIDEGILDSTPKQKKDVVGLAKDIAKNYSAKNTAASRLIELCQNEYPLLLISSSKFQALFDSATKSTKPQLIMDRFRREFANEIELLELKQKMVQQQEKKRARIENQDSAKKQKKDPENSIENQGTADKQIQDQERYNAILRDLYPDYNLASLDNRVTMKRKVKQWLKAKLGADFKNCRMVVPTGDNQNHQTYCVPGKFVTEFRSWALQEMKDLGML